MVMMMSSTVLANEVSRDTIQVYSEEFPDAYIITNIIDDTTTKTKSSDISLGTVEATVFIEEKRAVVNGEYVVTESRLMTQDEVEAIGVENFMEYNPRATATNSRGKLKITFSGTYSYINSGKGVNVKLTGNAGWSGNSIIDNSNNPAKGNDYI